VAVRGALRCDIDTALSEDEVVRVFNDTLGKRRWAKELFGSPSNWTIVPAPSDAKTAAEWVRNKHEERAHAVKPGGFKDSATMANLGTIIALGFNDPQNGRTTAHLFTSVVKKMENGKVNQVAVMTIRHQMKRVAAAVTKQDPSAQVRHHEDPE
jgi:hypothetical protein